MKKHKYEDIDGLLARHFAKEPLTERQNTELGEWIKANSGEYERLKKLLAAPLTNDGGQFFDTEKAWAKVEERLEPKVVKVDFRKKARTYISIAASVAVMIVLTMVYLLGEPEKKSVNYANNGNETETVVLPDGSEVVLYPNSTLAFSDGEVRNARLEGKAFFHVRKDKGRTFKVRTEELVVEVLGTSFLVDAESGESSGVFVETGRVRVSADEGQVVIQANEKAELSNGILTKGIIEDPEIFFNSADRYIVFRNVPLSKAVKEIEKRAGVLIELGKGVEDNSITTKIDIGNRSSIAAELSMVCGCECDTIESDRHYRLYYE